MKNHRLNILIIALLITSPCVFCQNVSKRLPLQGIITGKVTDEESNVPLVGASVIVQGTQNGAVVDDLGNYKISLAKGIYGLRVTFIGYSQVVTDSIKVNNNQTIVLNYKLSTRNPDSASWQTQARKDIAAGDVHLVTGLLALKVSQSIFDSIVAKYGFKYYSDCTANMFGTRYYNQEVYKYLDSLNGKGWKNRLDTELKNASRKKYY